MAEGASVLSSSVGTVGFMVWPSNVGASVPEGSSGSIVGSSALGDGVGRGVARGGRGKGGLSKGGKTPLKPPLTKRQSGTDSLLVLRPLDLDPPLPPFPLPSLRPGL